MEAEDDRVVPLQKSARTKSGLKQVSVEMISVDDMVEVSLINTSAKQPETDMSSKIPVHNSKPGEYSVYNRYTREIPDLIYRPV